MGGVNEVVQSQGSLDVKVSVSPMSIEGNLVDQTVAQMAQQTNQQMQRAINNGGFDPEMAARLISAGGGKT